MRYTSYVVRRAFVLGSALVLVGCDDLSRFDTDAGGLYRGEVVGDETVSFIRRGFAPHTELELEFHPLDADGANPGAITTYSPDGSAPVFDHVRLQAIAPLQHDLLSEYQFPGGGRLRNYVFVTRPTSGPLAGREPMVFVSLLDDGSVEVRIVAGAGDESRGDHFGLFRLRRR